MIRLQFVCSASLTSQAIAWFSSGHLSHVDAVLPTGELLGSRSDWVGNVPPGVRVRPAGYEKWTRRVVFSLETTRAEEAAFYRFLEGQIGKPYDHTASWAFVISRDWRDQDSWFCSELQAAALEHAGIVPPLYLAANKVTPVACALLLSAVGAVDRHFEPASP